MKPALPTNPSLQSWLWRLQAELWGNTLSSYPSAGARLPCYSCSASHLEVCAFLCPVLPAGALCRVDFRINEGLRLEHGWRGSGLALDSFLGFFDLPLLLLKPCALGMVGQELLPQPLVIQQARRSRRRPLWHTLLPAMLGEEPPAPSTAPWYQNKHQRE